MSFNFVKGTFHIGQASPDLSPQFIFYKRGFNLGGSSQPSWQDIILSGNTALTLTNALANGLNYLKLFGGTEQRNLPSEYVQNQFIWMKENSYLLTNIIPIYDGHYELDFQTTTVNINAAAYLGGRAGQSPAGLIFSHGSGNVLVTDAFGQRYSITYRTEDNTHYKYVFNNKVFTLYKNGEVVETHTFTSSTNSGAALAIKAINMGDSIDFAGEGIYFYGFKAWDNQGQLIADYIPATKLQGLVTGVYDKITNTFLTATSGEWSSGPALQPSPDTPMDIVCNNGVLKLYPNLFDKNSLTLGYIDDTGNIQTSTVSAYSAAMPVLPNTTYILNGLSFFSGSAYLRIHGYNNQDVWTSMLKKTNTESELTNPVIFTTGNSDYYVRFSYVRDNMLDAQFRRNGLYADGTTETVDVHSKNLFDVATYLSATISSGGTITATTGQNLYYMKVLPNNSYVFNYTTSASLSGNVVWGYAKDMPTIGGSATYNYMTIQNIKNNVFNVPAGYNYLLIRLDATSFVPNMTNIQLELGTTATTYEPYFNGGSATAERLLKVGDYKDTQEVLTGSVTRNVGIKVLDGTESWTLSGTGTAQDPKRFAVSELITFPDSDTVECLSTHYPFSGVAPTGANMIIGTFNIGIYNNIHYIRFAPTNITTLTDWTTFLADQYANGTPVIIVCPTNSTTTESVTGQPLTTQAGTNIVEITQSAIDNLGLEVSYKATV